ncbi:conserved hypothetical protein [Histoplasma mississippiense (nom. inval.)]|uniref:conserved hypothetical protein n=1 Tax=Ajellomyces capsulatus (strain NAm1 / WU24) TaxID=2059318 RepID=UPI000157BC82|nr:conserved hypothetical protein [Histoplasma mississippiense (nom. inval.)]EDN06229.1 conserved hypothetical protein [Histoplasma mississippiense (nom. inval.)]
MDLQTFRMAGTFSFQFTLLQRRRIISTQVISIYKDYSGPRANFVMTEDQDLLAKIGLLAGQINQHKNQATPPTQPSRGGRYTSYPSTHPRRHAGWAPYRGRASHPSSRRHAAPHRNRTLVLSNLSTPAESASGTPSCNASTDEMNEAKPVCQNGWVAKRDRHMQLINSAIYDKEAQARTKAIEESRKLKAQRIAQREEAKVLRYVQGVGGYRPVATPVVGQRAASYRITIQDVPFQVVQGGSKLIRLPNEPSAANVTPKKVNIGGVNFVPASKGQIAPISTILIKLPSAKSSFRQANVQLARRVTFLTNQARKGPLHVCISFVGAAPIHHADMHMFELTLLPHVDRAGQIRKIAANKAETTDDRDSADDDDILSDEEAYDEIDSDDVDSDDSDDDPIIITEGVDTGEISQQQDFVRFTS